uniref:alpha-N-acetylglucosaminidase TIM-barrel domain-containing protein n=1 Tax=uncultured Draconibacterium sp. TaxID=1573823 RepID=UPI0032178F03
MKKNILFSLILLCLFINNGYSNQFINKSTDTLKILIPTTGEKAYEIAGQTFANIWEKVTGEKPSVYYMEPDQRELPEGKIILIGSDAVNPVVHELIREGTLESLDIQYGGDNYRMLSLSRNGSNYLILAGGSGRSTIYAVYDFFRKQAGAEYFWDGDIIPEKQQVQLSGIDVLEKPHFEYRGLRYFAHRGLHRFQAEHWDLEDWKREIDWLMKKRFNLFMIRTGIDDLFQRAFPEDVPYPPVDEQDPDAEQRSYNDRTSFWPLKYRGELRKQVLQYARDRGLLHPEDIGTITHWYSHTPSSFYKNNPDFPVITNQRSGYSLPSHAIWDIEAQETWDAYWKLTETHIKEFGDNSPRMFHTIGMAERVFGKSDIENLQSKLYVYRKTQQKLREHYPDQPLLIGSWDFIGWKWTDEGVQQLMSEFDPTRTILLDYTSDKDDKVTYRDWDVHNKFPWIFGIFHSLAKNSDIHEDYSILTPRLKEAAADPKCIGFITWPEISHSDTYLLEYFADNSWQPDKTEIEIATKHFCEKRYLEEIEKEMKQIWDEFLNISQTLHWGLPGSTILFWEPQFRILSGDGFISHTPQNIENLDKDLQRVMTGLTDAPKVLKKLSLLASNNYDNSLWRRDVLDMARTIASRAIFASLAQGTMQVTASKNIKSSEKEIKRISKLNKQLMASLSDILAMSDDFSMYASLKQLEKAEQLNGIPSILNPHSEQALKGNAENNYCRSHHYELVEYVYRPELEFYWDWFLKRIKSDASTEWKRPAEFKKQEKLIEDKFYATPLSEMAPTKPRNAKSLEDTLNYLEELINELLNER